MHDSHGQKQTRRPDLVFRTVATPIGDMTLAFDGDGALCMAEFADCVERTERWLERRPGRSHPQRLGGGMDAASAFAAYFAGDLRALDAIPISLTGTPFQNEVWTALREIRPGSTFGYGAFAEKLGRAQAARAVGHANGTNPLSIVVPCHRLVGAGGALTKYGGGLARKRWLLDHEARYAAQSEKAPTTLRLPNMKASATCWRGARSTSDTPARTISAKRR
jgi:methylated-DNA-[protein]-cysteine S-methyltransferase